jgi:tetratricopeptide (TPR) repeat protein
MLGSRMIYNFYNLSKTTICSSYRFIKNLPNLYRTKSSEFKNYLADFRHKLSNLSDTNYDLGLYHLHRQNLNDAIIRFKLIDKFLRPDDPKANYLLGWCYFFKNKAEKAIHHLNKAKAKLEDKVKLGVFLENYNKCADIPDEI